MQTRKKVSSEQRRVRQLFFRKGGAGTPVLDEGGLSCGTITDTGTGDYLITFTKAFRRKPVCQLTCLTSAKTVRLGTLAVGSVQVLGFNQADGTTAAEADFHLTVSGFDDEDES